MPDAPAPAPLLDVRGLAVHFPVRRGALQRVTGQVRAVDGVDFTLAPRETLGLVGESGCGKSTLSRALVGLVQPSAGEMWFGGHDVFRLRRAEAKRVRRDIQIIFQDPVSSLNPSFSVADIVLEGRRIQGLADPAEDDALVQDMLRRVGLGPDIARRRPHELSGGQRQRVGIARTLILRPKLIVADEPVSALDVSVQSQVLNLLVELRRELGLTYVFIAHNLAVVSYIADRVAVMYLGRIVELAPAETIYARPLHPYTVALLSAMPDPAVRGAPDRLRLAGDVPSPIDPPSGCHFRTRCPIAAPVCAELTPPLAGHGGGQFAACHFPGKLQARTKGTRR